MWSLSPVVQIFFRYYGHCSMPGVGRFYPKYSEPQFWSDVHSGISPQIKGLEVCTISQQHRWIDSSNITYIYIEFCSSGMFKLRKNLKWLTMMGEILKVWKKRFMTIFMTFQWWKPSCGQLIKVFKPAAFESSWNVVYLLKKSYILSKSFLVIFNIHFWWFLHSRGRIDIFETLKHTIPL